MIQQDKSEIKAVVVSLGYKDMLAVVTPLTTH